MKLDSLTIRGYKSIRELENFPLRNLNVLIGANGAGKSNFISLFRLLAAISHGNLQGFVQKQGGPDPFLFKGRKATTQIYMDLAFGQNSYHAILEPTVDNRLIFQNEQVRFGPDWYYNPNHTEEISHAHEESELTLSNARSRVSAFVFLSLENVRVYHFHDTSETAVVKQQHPSNDNLLPPPATHQYLTGTTRRRTLL